MIFFVEVFLKVHNLYMEKERLVDLGAYYYYYNKS
jgi:hypothetical protein